MESVRNFESPFVHRELLQQVLNTHRPRGNSCHIYFAEQTPAEFVLTLRAILHLANLLPGVGDADSAGVTLRQKHKAALALECTN